jgi:multiple sugar transport system permease protein
MKKWNITIFVILIALGINVPLINTLITSFKNDADISLFPKKFFSEPTLVHFSNVLFDAGYNFPKYFANSLVLSILTCLIVIIITLPASYVIIRLRFGSNKLLPFAAGLKLFPPIIFAIPYYLMFQYIGLLDTVFGLVLINVFLNVPLGILLMVGFLQDIPAEIEESAKIDGCSIYGVLMRIIIPLMKPGIASVGILTFIFTWNDYLFAVIMSLNNATPVTLGATMFITSWGIKWGDVSAATILSILPPLLFTLVAQKYLVSGLSMGAVKG